MTSGLRRRLLLNCDLEAVKVKVEGSVYVGVRAVTLWYVMIFQLSRVGQAPLSAMTAETPLVTIAASGDPGSVMATLTVPTERMSDCATVSSFVCGHSAWLVLHG